MNDDFMDAVNMASFVVGLVNYQENLTQSDKDDIMKGLDEQTKILLNSIQRQLEQQNEMLREILERLE